jgi:hypothetical protein
MKRGLPLLLLGLALGCGNSDADAVAHEQDAGTATGGSGGSVAIDSGGGFAGVAGTDGGIESGSDADATTDAGPDAPSCPPPTVFEYAGPFVPSLATPTWRADIDMPSGQVFQRIRVDLDFVRGPWASPAPSSGGISNLFWLHRGKKGNHWLNNVVGYMNFKGHGHIEVNDNLGITDPAIWNQALNQSLATSEGTAYHATYVYNAGGQKYWFSVTEGQTQVAYREGVPLLSEVLAQDSWLANGAPGFFVQIGNVAWDGTAPEVPTFDWVYSNLVIEFFPPCG